jgi:tRNA (guanine37-N1)-methyltransferase
MRFHILTIFPDMFQGPTSQGIIGRGIDSGVITVNLTDIREFTNDKHRSVDDYPFGGSPGMLMKPEPVFEAVESVQESAGLGESAPVVLLSPQGRRLTQGIVEDYAKLEDLVLVCGRYEGFDERIRQELATDELSIGDYVLGGGELAAMVIIEATSRLIPGVVGSIESTEDDSFTTGLLQHPQYTRPAEYRGLSVPDVLISGNHAKIRKWRRQESLRRTWRRRPDLLDTAALTAEDRQYLEDLEREGDHNRGKDD